jgi:hypothetical protein
MTWPGQKGNAARQILRAAPLTTMMVLSIRRFHNRRN